MIAWLTDPFTFEFMQRALMASLIVGVLCSVIGTFVVLRAMAFLGDALAHAILPGVAIAYLLGANLLLGALVAAVLVAVGIGLFSRRGGVKEDTAIGILFAAALALGVLLMSTVRSYATDLTHILFGNVLGVSAGDLWLTGVLAVVVLTVLILFFKEFQLASFDPVLAHMLGKRPETLRFAMLILLALTIVVGLQTVGVGLVAAMLVTPAATAYLLTRRLAAMMVVSAVIGAFSSVAGLYASYYLDVASGAAVVLVATAAFLLAYFFAPRRGLRRPQGAAPRRLTPVQRHPGRDATLRPAGARAAAPPAPFRPPSPCEIVEAETNPRGGTRCRPRSFWATTDPTPARRRSRTPPSSPSTSTTARCSSSARSSSRSATSPWA